MKIVKFKDGTFGIRRWTMFGREWLYFATTRSPFWLSSPKEDRCHVDEGVARVHYIRLTDKGTPIAMRGTAEKERDWWV